MAGEIVLLDASILIDYYCKKGKSRTQWGALARAGHGFAVSTVTKYEIYAGATAALEVSAVDVAVGINHELKRKRKQIHLADLFIASTALANELPLATLNKKHFERIAGLDLLEF